MGFEDLSSSFSFPLVTTADHLSPSHPVPTILLCHTSSLHVLLHHMHYRQKHTSDLDLPLDEADRPKCMAVVESGVLIL